MVFGTFSGDSECRVKVQVLLVEMILLYPSHRYAADIFLAKVVFVFAVTIISNVAEPRLKLCFFFHSLQVFDAGIAQYLLVDDKSHDLFFASLILGKPSLRCKLADDEPKDILDEKANNMFTLVYLMKNVSECFNSLSLGF